MLIHLPVETWLEILEWLRRWELVVKLDQLWDREFTPIVQDWLHKYTRNVCIGPLSMEKNGLYFSSDLANDLYCKVDFERVPIAKVAMPENVASFERIEIRYLDSAMLTLLRQMSPLFRSNVHLQFRCSGINSMAANRRAFRLLLAMLCRSNNSGHGQQIEIESIFSHHQLLQLFYYSVANCPPSSVPFFNARLLCIGSHRMERSAKVINEMLISWLFTRREDGQPRTLVFGGEGKQQAYSDFYTKVRERFLDPSRQCASAFFIRNCSHYISQIGQPPNTSVSDENARTGERMTVHSNGYGRICLITNHCPLLDADPEWLARNVAEVLRWEFRKYNSSEKTICLCDPEIGPLNAEDAKQLRGDTLIGRMRNFFGF